MVMNKRLSDARDVSWYLRFTAGLLVLAFVFGIVACRPDPSGTAVLPVQDAIPDRIPPAGEVAVDVVNASLYLASVEVDYFINDILVHHAEAVLAGASGSDPNTSLHLGFDEADRVVIRVEVQDSPGEVLWSDEKTYLLGEDFQDQDTIEYTIIYPPVPANRPPVAVAVATPNPATSGALVTLDGSGSYDPDGDEIVSYIWEQLSGTPVDLSSTFGAVVTFTAPAPVLAAGADGPEIASIIVGSMTLSFRLTVYDQSLSDSTQVDVVVQLVSPNRPPVAVAVATPNPATSGTLVTLDGTDSYDPDGDEIVSYIWEQLSGTPVDLSSTFGAVVTFTAPSVPVVGVDGVFGAAAAGAYPSSETLSFRLTVWDAFGSGSAQVDVVVRLVAPNRPPVADLQSSYAAVAGQLMPLDASGSSDADGDPLLYQFSQISGTPVGGLDPSSSDSSYVLVMVPQVTVPETAVFQVTVFDGRGGSATATASVIFLENYSSPQAVAQASPATPPRGSVVTLDGSASTVTQGLSLTYKWQQLNSPPDPTVVLSATDQAIVTFTAPDVASPTTLTFQLTVSDGTTSGSGTVNVYVMPSGTPNTPPVAMPMSISQALVGEDVTLYGSGSNTGARP